MEPWKMESLLLEWSYGGIDAACKLWGLNPAIKANRAKLRHEIQPEVRKRWISHFGIYHGPWTSEQYQDIKRLLIAQHRHAGELT